MSEKLGNITIFRNVFKKRPVDGEREQPDYRGKIDVDGKQYKCSLWINQDLNGTPLHLSGQISEEESP